MAHLFTYEIPARLVARARPGMRVLCSSGRGAWWAFVMASAPGEPPRRSNHCSMCWTTKPALTDELLDFLRDLSAYYLAPIER